MDARRHQYLFESIDLPTLRLWYARLHYFRFLRAVGGHANDGDSLNAALRYHSESDLLDLLCVLGLSAGNGSVLSSEVPLAAPRPSFVPDTNHLRQPGHCQIGGSDVFVWCSGSAMIISANPLSYTVEEIHVQAAEAVENVLRASLHHRILDPPGESPYYLCPHNYPDLEW
jgi:hypothetical protein